MHEQEAKEIQDRLLDIRENWSKEEHIELLKSAGILDENGKLAEIYNSVKALKLKEDKMNTYIVTTEISSYIINAISKEEAKEIVRNHLFANSFDDSISKVKKLKANKAIYICDYNLVNVVDLDGIEC